jgi:hypothetical protein
MSKIQAVLYGVLLMQPILMWGHVTFINETGARLLVQFLTPELTSNNKPGARVFIEQFIIWESQKKEEHTSFFKTPSVETVIDSVFGGGNRKHAHQYDFIPESITNFKRPAVAFVVKGFFCFATECEYGICGVVDRTAAQCDWVTTPQCALEDGATYIITLKDDSQLLVKKGTKDVALEKHPWPPQDFVTVSTYFTVTGKHSIN